MEQFKEGQAVLVRQHKDSVWRVRVYYLDEFCHFDGSPGDKTKWTYILPYEGNEELYGTTKNPSPKPKEGEWWMCERQDGNLAVLKAVSRGFWASQIGNFVVCQDLTPLYRMIPEPDGQPTKT